MPKATKTKEPITKGYKVTNQDMTCLQYQFELNKLFEETGVLKICNNGFHFCRKAADCFNYYSFNTSNRVFEIEAYGELDESDDKSCCLKIKLIRELTWNEVLELVNTGKACTGLANSGYRNSGDSNSGNWNSGNWNSGDRNSGDSNSGDSNSGNWNSGNWNSGNWNSGDRNSGDSNSGYRNSGAFCINKNPELMLFDKPSGISVREWENGEVVGLMNRLLEFTIWIPDYAMSEDEKKDHPKWETTEGYLKTIGVKEAWANMWNNLTETNKALFTSLPNFDAAIFESITGIKI